MADDLCPRGTKLSEAASLADHVFKSNLVHVLSSVKRDQQELEQLELLGEGHREADEALRRHRRFCAVCSETQQVAAPYTVLN